MSFEIEHPQLIVLSLCFKELPESDLGIEQFHGKHFDEGDAKRYVRDIELMLMDVEKYLPNDEVLQKAINIRRQTLKLLGETGNGSA